MTGGVKQHPSTVAVAEALSEALSERCGPPVTLTLTENRRRLVSYRTRGLGVDVRVSRRLLALGSAVVGPIVEFVSGKPDSRDALRRMIAQVPEAPIKRRPLAPMNPRGDTYDLAVLVARESVHALGVEQPVAITWGPRRQMRRQQRSIRLGAYDFEREFIRIHRRLDASWVPEWFVGFVVFHELLHHRFGVVRFGKRRIIHSAEFRSAEAQHPRFSDARRWEKVNLPRLLAGSPLPRRR